MKTLERNEKLWENQGGILTKLLISLLMIALEYYNLISSNGTT